MFFLDKFFTSDIWIREFENLAETNFKAEVFLIILEIVCKFVYYFSVDP